MLGGQAWLLCYRAIMELLSVVAFGDVLIVMLLHHYEACDEF